MKNVVGKINWSGTLNGVQDWPAISDRVNNNDGNFKLV